MHKLYELKDKLVDELESYVENGKITPTAAEEIKVLSASIDHICNICKDAEDDEYSSRMYPYGMNSYRGYAREDRGGYSNARGRMNAQRDSRGRYSGADGDVEDIKRDMQRLMDKVEKM